MAQPHGTSRLLRVINIFRQIDMEMPIQYVTCFLEISHHEGISVGELATRMGMAQSSASRQVSSLSKFREKMRPGLDLVESYADPMERRKKIIGLTPKGKALAIQINEMMEE